MKTWMWTNITNRIDKNVGEEWDPDSWEQAPDYPNGVRRWDSTHKNFGSGEYAIGLEVETETRDQAAQLFADVHYGR